MPTNEATEPSNGTSSSGIVNSSSNENTEGACYDPDASVTCWKPSKDFSSFLEKNFRWKLSYDQVLDILETNSVSSVDALASPTLDLAIINQISNPLSKKHAQERDKEIVSVQRSVLDATGPLCCLHDALESNDNINVSNKDVKFMLEQALCLLGSANYQISVLRRKKECYLGMTFHPSPRNRLTCHVAFLKISHQMQGAKFLALPNVVDLGQSPCGAPLTLGLLPLQSTLRTVQKNAFFVLKGRSNKNQPAPTSVGANNVRSRGVKYCKGFSNRFSFNPSSVLPSCHKGKFFRNPADRCRGPGIVKERSYSGRQSLRPGLLQRSISCSQERGHLPARDRVEFIKAFCSPRSFSDRGAPLFKDPSKERGLHDKYRSKRHIFFRSNSQILSKVSWFHLGHKTLHLSGSPFRSQLSTPNIHQAPETCSRLPEEAGVSHNNLFRRRPSSSCLLQRGSIASNLNVVKSITVPGLSHKLDEINTVPRSVNNIPRFCHKLCEYDHLLIRGQSSKGLCSLQQLSLSTSNVRTTARQPPRNPGVLSPCHMGSPLAPKGSSNPAHTNPEEPPVRLQLSSISQSQVSSRANLVAKQFTQGQRQPCFPPTTGSHNSLKCFNARLGCHVSGQDH